MTESQTLHAFPMGNHEQGGNDGMTLRDWFAGQFACGRMARASHYTSWVCVAKDAYELADAMLTERAVQS